MRIISGSHRGLTLSAPKGLHTRPTSDRVREAIFSSLGQRVIDANVLDLFAGTGAMGLEALSRGARHATFCENNRQTFSVLQKNITRAREEAQSTVYFGNVFSFFEKRLLHGPYDLIFIDPPYRDGLYMKSLNCIKKQQLLAPNGMIVLESAKKPLFSLDDTVFLLYKSKTYGESCVQYLISTE